VEGLDEDWVNAGNNTSVRFSLLPPGQYTFHVAASLNGKDWYGASPFTFTIKPPFWKTWWFRLLAALAVAAIIWAIVRLRIRSIRKAASIKQQLTELEIKALRSQMNPHFIFNALNSIQHFVFNNDVDKTNHYLTQFSKLLRMVLQHSKQPTISLTDEMKMLELYLKIEALRMGPDFAYSITADETIEEPDAVYLPSMLVQPFVENSLKHGLLTKTGNKKLTVAFKMAGNHHLFCSVTDNGIGREKAMNEAAGQLIQIPHSSDGIALVQSRLQLHDKLAANTVSIFDLKNEDGTPAGTRVELQIPIQ
jgi:LytS/YehU family sensor histidine kinase